MHALRAACLLSLSDSLTLVSTTAAPTTTEPPTTTANMPPFDFQPRIIRVSEDVSVGTRVATLSASDSDGQVLTYQITSSGMGHAPLASTLTPMSYII